MNEAAQAAQQSHTYNTADWYDHHDIYKAKQEQAKDRENRVKEASSGVLCVVCNTFKALPCVYCKNAPSPSGDPVPFVYYCSNTCATSDWPNHEAYCLASKNRRALFEVAEVLQEKYYTACAMDLLEVCQTGLNCSQMVRYDRQSLQRRIDAISENREQDKAFLGCFGGNNPMLFRRREVTKHFEGEKSSFGGTICNDGLHCDAIRDLRWSGSTDVCLGLDIEIHEMTICMEDRTRRFSFEEQAISIMDQHEVLQITMNNSEKYVLDIAGAQFGLYAPIVPFQQYVDSHVREINGYKDFVYA